MVTLYDNPFSPFARKVRMVLRHKGIAFESIDALALCERERLLAVNPRAEVPVLVDGEVTVTNSAEIVAYLEDRYPVPSLMPSSAGLRARARHWERIADTLLDAIIHDISLWVWPTHRRTDHPPPGLLEAGQRDLAAVLARFDDALGGGEWLCGDLSVADLALFPHVSSLRLLGVELERFARVQRWNGRLRAIPAVQADLDHVRRSATEKFAGTSPYEGEQVVWRGDRIEWLLAHGHWDWFQRELAAGVAVVPRSI